MGLFQDITDFVERWYPAFRRLMTIVFTLCGVLGFTFTWAQYQELLMTKAVPPTEAVLQPAVMYLVALAVFVLCELEAWPAGCETPKYFGISLVIFNVSSAVCSTHNLIATGVNSDGSGKFLVGSYITMQIGTVGLLVSSLAPRLELNIYGRLRLVFSDALFALFTATGIIAAITMISFAAELWFSLNQNACPTTNFLFVSVFGNVGLGMVMGMSSLFNHRGGQEFSVFLSVVFTLFFVPFKDGFSEVSGLPWATHKKYFEATFGSTLAYLLTFLLYRCRGEYRAEACESAEVPYFVRVAQRLSQHRRAVAVLSLTIGASWYAFGILHKYHGLWLVMSDYRALYLFGMAAAAPVLQLLGILSGFEVIQPVAYTYSAFCIPVAYGGIQIIEFMVNFNDMYEGKQEVLRALVLLVVGTVMTVVAPALDRTSIFTVLGGGHRQPRRALNEEMDGVPLRGGHDSKRLNTTRGSAGVEVVDLLADDTAEDILNTKARLVRLPRLAGPKSQLLLAPLLITIVASALLMMIASTFVYYAESSFLPMTTFTACTMLFSIAVVVATYEYNSLMLRFCFFFACFLFNFYWPKAATAPALPLIACVFFMVPYTLLTMIERRFASEFTLTQPHDTESNNTAKNGAPAVEPLRTAPYYDEHTRLLPY